MRWDASRSPARRREKGVPTPSWAGACVLAGLLGFLSGIPAGGVSAQWISPPGEGWVDLTLRHQDTRERFDLDGTRRDIFAEGRAVTWSAFLTGNVGLLQGTDLWVELPVHRLRFDDAGGERESSGVGDPRIFLRAGPELLGLPPWPVALRGGVKLDVGDFDVDAEVIPLGEGQRDWELLLELGRSLHPRSLWTMGWVGHRWREANPAAQRTPGDEWFWWWSLGGEAGPVAWRMSLEGLSGGVWTLEGGIRPPSTRRRFRQAMVDAGVGLGPGTVRLGLEVPVSGRNLPAGAAVSVGYFVRWDRGMVGR